MDESPELLMSQALLEKLEPLIHTIESQLRDLGQGQVIIQDNIAQLSSELSMTQGELDKVHDTFARLPHYIAKLTAMKNTIATVTATSRKLKRRAEQVAIGREKQHNKAQAAMAKEQAYDQEIAAVQSIGSGQAPSASAGGIGEALGSQNPPPLSPQSRSPSSMPSIRLPFPAPAKPAFPIVSTMRTPNGSGSPPPSTLQRLSPNLSGRGIISSALGSPGEPNLDPSEEQFDSNTNNSQQPLVDRFPQITSISDDAIKAEGSSMEVEVVRLKRKKKARSKSSASSIASTGTTDSYAKRSSLKTVKDP
ncbi:hypothetical protein FBU30_000829 [Linnemannia zychae]|nr:hypothetical protein FBU30_000829 [Linnemannia zychae]